MRISDWSSDVCSSDLVHDGAARKALCLGARLLLFCRESGDDETDVDVAAGGGDFIVLRLQLFDGASHGAEGQVAPAFRSNGDTLAVAGEAIERAWQEVAAEAEADGAGSDGDTGILGPEPAPGQEALAALGSRRVIEQGGFGFRQAAWNENKPRLPKKAVAIPVCTFVGHTTAGLVYSELTTCIVRHAVVCTIHNHYPTK